MKKYILLSKRVFLALLLFSSIPFFSFSQSKFWSVDFGNSYTRYDFVNSKGVKIDYLKPGFGNAYSLGYSSTLLDTSVIAFESTVKAVYFANRANLTKILSRTEFGLKVIFNQYNAVGSVQHMDFDYQTNFIGLEGNIGPNFEMGKNWKIHAQVQTSLQYFIQGFQHINFTYVDLRQDPDFNGFSLFVGYSGILEKKVTKSIRFFITYSNTQTTKPRQTSASTLNFNSTYMGIGMKILRLD